MTRSEAFKKAIVKAGYDYAKDCFDSFEEDDDVPRLSDGRINPHCLDLGDAACEVLNVFLDEIIVLDKQLFHGEINQSKLFDLMEELLPERDEYFLFLEGELKYISEVYGDNWETIIPDI